jgi:L-threonylcarbamoyladenylate synthase
VAVVVRVNPAQLNRSAIERVARGLRAGHVAAVPTDTVYGLAGDPFRPAVVERIFRLKGRAENKPILLLAASQQQAETLAASLPAAFERLAARFWPGPLTMIVPASNVVPRTITAGTGTVAIRVPGSVLARELIRAARRPLTGTSANRSGWPAAWTAAQVAQQFPTGLDWILDGGPAPSRAPSTIVDLTGAVRVVREGAIPQEAVLCLA